MDSLAIRPAYDCWPRINATLRDAVAGLTPAQLETRATPEGWPLWAIVGHLACQRVFWLCDFAGEPGADATPFTNAVYDCPGDDDLEHALDGPALAAALDSSFAIVERVLDTWTIDSLAEVLRRPEWDDSWVKQRGEVVQRVFAHDIYHGSEASIALGLLGLPALELWP
jgi:hypothetical protein